MTHRKPPAITIQHVFAHGLAAVAAALLFTSCQHDPSEQILKAINAKTDQRRPASLEPWTSKTIHGQSALNYASSSSAILTSLDTAISLRTEQSANGWTSVVIKFKGKPGGSLVIGSAVPVSRDGYFLTAAHCVGKPGSTLQILAKTPSPPVSLAGARVVWRSKETQPNEPDLAIVHAPIKPEIFVKVAAPDRLKTGLPVLTSGVGSFKKSWGGGHLLSVTSPQTSPSGVTWRQLTHSAPFTPGDSGGPMLSAEGELLGINSQIVLTNSSWIPFVPGPWHYEYGVCFHPDPAWLNSIIQRDRARRSKKK